MKAVDFGGAEIELPEEKKEPAHAGDVEAGFTGQSGKPSKGQEKMRMRKNSGGEISEIQTLLHARRFA